LAKKDSNNSKYGQIITKTVKKNPMNTFMLIEAVAGVNAPIFKG